MKLRFSFALFAVVFTLGSAGVANADVITWGTPQDIAASRDVSTNGTLVFAGRGGLATSVTVNGVTFVVDGQFSGANGNNNQGLPTGDANYDSLINFFAGGPFASTTFTPQGAFVAGNTYEIQIWQSNTNGFGSGQGTIDDGNGNLVTLDQDAGAIGGQYVIGTFVADDSNAPVITFGGTRIYNAYQVRDLGVIAVPEPASFGILAVAGMGLAVRRRKR